MTARDGSAAVSESTRRPAAWLVATVLAVTVSAMMFSLPFIVHWAWPGLDAGLMMISNMFLGVILGSAAVIGFLRWKWGEL